MSWESLNSHQEYFTYGGVGHQLSATRLLSSPDGSRHPLDGTRDPLWPWNNSYSSLHRDSFMEVRTTRPVFAFGCFRACQSRIHQSIAKRKVEQGVKLYNQHKQQQAVRKWKSALKVIKKREDKFLLLGYLYQAYMDWGKYRDALEYGHQQLCISEELDNPNMRAESYLNLARSHQRLGGLERALAYARHSLYNECEQCTTSGHVHLTVGSVYLELAGFHKALESMQHAHRISQAIHDPALELQVYIALSELFSRLQDADKSAKYASKAYDLSRSLQLGDLNSRHHRAALLQMASSLRKQGELGDAQDYCSEANRLALVSGDQASHARSIRIMGDIYRKKFEINKKQNDKYQRLLPVDLEEKKDQAKENFNPSKICPAKKNTNELKYVSGLKSPNIIQSKRYQLSCTKKRWFGLGEDISKRPEKVAVSNHTVRVNKKTEDTPRKRYFNLPLSKNALLRGQTSPSSKLDGQIHTPEDLSRSSSINNLNVLEQQATTKVKTGGTKPRKSSSRDKLDRIGSGTGTTERKHEKKGVTKNNNKFDSGDAALALDSLQELESLRGQLQQMTSEKSNLALELGEQKGHIHVLQHQIENLKMYQEQSSLQVEQLTEENTALRNRLRDVAHSPLSDNEKQQLLFESHRHHSSAPASIATNPLDDGPCGDVTACTTPDWDKHSSSNVSEVSVACLQDKINQMQETHYSTNEELQATLQELTDLQRQLTELQQENERLLEEKNLMFDSLCRQTERLKDTRQEVESLKMLLYREKDEAGMESAQEREEKLVDLLKSAQDEHESLLAKHEQLSGELQETREANEALHEQLKVLTERNRTLESTLDAKHAEHKLLDQELALAKDQSSGRQIEINRLKDLLENARTKINELEQDRAMSDKSELDELLDNARKEKDTLESEVTHLKEQLARSKNEIEKLKEQVSILQEECKVIRNNARTVHSDLEYKCEKLLTEKNVLNDQLHSFQEVINELQVQAQCHAEDKRNLSDVLAETQRNLSESERKIMVLENELADVKKLRKDENEEWEKFQNDLLTSVRVANDFKTEAQQDLQKMIMENKEHRDKVRQLEAQLDQLKVNNDAAVALRPSSYSGGEELTRRAKIGLTRQNSRQSVKSLIESIENQGKPVIVKNPLSAASRSSSSSSINSMTSDPRTPSSPSGLMIGTPSFSPVSPLRAQSDWCENVPPKAPLKEQQPNKLVRDWSKTHITDSLHKNELTRGKSEETYRESILQKSIDFSRRNSYSDLSERKDPLNGLIKNGGSKRNALLKWCQNKTVGYQNIDITNFSSSWNDGLALCALLHTYLPDRIPYETLSAQEKRRNFSLAFAAAESVGISTTLNMGDMIQLERPDWQQVMSYVTAIYKHFET